MKEISSSSWRRWVAAAWVAFAGTLALVSARSSLAAEETPIASWIGTWAASPQAPDTTALATTGFTNQTLRQVVFASLGGDSLRVRFSNEFSEQPLTIGAAQIAVALPGGAIQGGSGRALTFAGQPSVTIVPNAQIISDPVSLSVEPASDLSIDVYLPNGTGPVTWHRRAMQTTYISPAGNFVGAASLPVETTTAPNYFFLKLVEVQAAPDTGVLVAFGDSITDGVGSAVDTDSRYPNHLARLLAASSGNPRMAVLNQGISGNRVLTNSVTGGQNVQARFDRDVLSMPGVTQVIVLIGINDSSDTFVADQVILGHQQLIQRAHARGLKIYGATLTPAGSTGNREANRQAINDWIRTSGEYDAVIDFDAATLDPQNPTFFLPLYNSGDNLHPSGAGYEAMATAAFDVLNRVKGN